jgi:hypothetical protein
MKMAAAFNGCVVKETRRREPLQSGLRRLRELKVELRNNQGGTAS